MLYSRVGVTLNEHFCTTNPADDSLDAKSSNANADQ